jgi:hypothetical protein
MGIDARILIRTKGPKPTEAQLSEWSWNVCRSIGAKHFFINDGLPAAEYRRAEKAWHAAFHAHPEYPRYEALSDASHAYKWPQRPSEADDKEERAIGDRIRAAIGPVPEQRRRAIDLASAIYDLDEYDDVPESHREPGRVYCQDGAPILASDGEWLLTVSLWTRYYGPDYERGDILTICAIAEWIEANIPGAEVWYGGDSSGVLAKPFHEAERKKMRAHLYGADGRDYYNYRSSFMQKPKGPRPQPCGLCIGPDNFAEFGWGRGGQYLAVHCAGCGKSFKTEDGGTTWAEDKKEAA